MAIFGSTFDDSVFSGKRDRVSVSLTPYNAKLCEPEWFCESAALDTDECLEKQKVFKFRGDLALRRGNYQKALDSYSSCLEWIADNNLSTRRDVLEGMARCCAKLGQTDKALHLVDLLRKEMSNTCHLTGLLLLEVTIYQHSGCVRAQISCLQQLCSLLPFNPWHWHKLGLTCVQLLESNRTTTPCSFTDSESSPQSDEEEGESATKLGDDGVWLKACACFIRTRLLLRILRQQQSSFVLRRTEDTLMRTDEALQRLNPTETTLQALTEVMSEDLIPEKIREDNQDGESLTSVCVQNFTERWWNKILQRRVLEADGRSTRTDACLETAEAGGDQRTC